jgi:hypothetical protein
MRKLGEEGGAYYLLSVAVMRSERSAFLLVFLLIV